MSAHLRSIVRNCQHDSCRKVAVVQLFNGRNAPMGVYCQKHGSQALADHKREYE